jgi:hypothetical protein
LAGYLVRSPNLKTHGDPKSGWPPKEPQNFVQYYSSRRSLFVLVILLIHQTGYQIFTDSAYIRKKVSNWSIFMSDPSLRPTASGLQAANPQASTADFSSQKIQIEKAAQELEATFLAEVMKSAGLGKSSEFGGGGVGEDQFASFMVMEHARAMARNGGIGLAEMFVKSMMERES